MIMFCFRPPESKKTERQRSKTDSRQGASSKVSSYDMRHKTELHTTLMIIGGQGGQDDPRERGLRRLWAE